MVVEDAVPLRGVRVEQPALVVWPENASDIDPFEDPAAYDLIDAAVKDIGVPVLVGAVLQGPGEQVSNAAAMTAAAGRAQASGLPACINVMIEGVAAPQIRR